MNCRSLGEVDKDVAQLRVGFKNLKAELELQKARVLAGQSDPNDQFVPVMTDFVTVATFGFTELEEMLVEAKKRVSGLVKYLCRSVFFN